MTCDQVWTWTKWRRQMRMLSNVRLKYDLLKIISRYTTQAYWPHVDIFLSISLNCWYVHGPCSCVVFFFCLVKLISTKCILYLTLMYLFLGVRSPNLSSSISFNSKGPTTGVLNVGTAETKTKTAITAEVEEMDTISSTEKVFYICITLPLERFLLSETMRLEGSALLKMCKLKSLITFRLHPRCFEWFYTRQRHLL